MKYWKHRVAAALIGFLFLPSVVSFWHWVFDWGPWSQTAEIFVAVFSTFLAVFLPTLPFQFLDDDA